MASKFVVPVRDQSFLELVSYRDVLGVDHLVWTVIDVVEGLDLSLLYERYAPDVGGGGRPALDPAMLVALLFFGYCEGKRSSRQLEDACVRDWAYRAICGGLAPDHATIARFRQGMDDVLEGLFGQVLMACATAGMVNVGVVALDGTRMGSVASKEANRTAATLEKMQAEARRMLDEAAQADSHDTNADGDSTSSSGVGGVNDGSGRVSCESRRVTDQVRRGVRIREAQQVVTDAGVRGDAEVTKRQKPKRPIGNVTDPESRLQKTRGGFIQGYNAQSVVSGDQVVVACDVTSNPTDQAQLKPMLRAAATNVAEAGVTDPISVALADAGYASEANFGAETGLGISLLIATGKTHKVGERDNDNATAVRDRERVDVFRRVDAGQCSLSEAAGILGISYSWVSTLRSRYLDHGDLGSESMLAWRAMRDKLAVPQNRDLYKKRGWLIEGSYAHIKTHRGTDSFLRHGLTACQAEWNLINIAGNLRKLHKKRLQTSPTSPTDPLNASDRPIRPISVRHRPISRPVALEQRPDTHKPHHNRCPRHNQ
ncbi:MAG: transposase [Acidimicrobiia bacterium]